MSFAHPFPASPAPDPETAPGMSDDALVAALRMSRTIEGTTPVAALIARHGPCVSDYAEICASGSPDLARALAATAFRHVVRDLQRAGSTDALRPRLLVVVRDTVSGTRIVGRPRSPARNRRGHAALRVGPGAGAVAIGAPAHTCREFGRETVPGLRPSPRRPLTRSGFHTARGAAASGSVLLLPGHRRTAQALRHETGRTAGGSAARRERSPLSLQALGQEAWRPTAWTRWSTSCSVVAKEVTRRTTPGPQRSW
ncbi:hypothetical protein SAMN04487980_102048 [Streptomyces sp. cf124]|nr:hypothetical protein SAMN04487980_102048 [Streptomyces sp. cf124]